MIPWFSALRMDDREAEETILQKMFLDAKKRRRMNSTIYDIYIQIQVFCGEIILL